MSTVTAGVEEFTSAHVRATTAGSLSLDNCHPFVHGKLMVSQKMALLGFKLRCI